MSYGRYDRSAWNESHAYDEYDHPDRRNVHAPTPGKRTLTDGLARRAADLGTSAPTTALPYAERIQESFGPGHDVSSIRAHVGGAAADAARELGAKAYAIGDHAVFAHTPDLHTAAHEAAHVVQQAHGVSLYGGVDRAGDAYERMADAVADRVVDGRSAADLLGPPSGGAAGGSAVVQRKEDPEAERENVFVTTNGSPVDEKTGVMDHQVDMVEDFCATAQRHLDTWAQQRGGKTADLRFKKASEMTSAYGAFRTRLARDPLARVAWEGARKRLDTPRNRQFIEEIRMFANDLLGDYKRLLDIEDREPSHMYELKPISDSSTSVGLYGKVGIVTRRIEIRYRNTQIDELTWTQEVLMSGMLGSVGISRGDVKKGKAGKAPEASGGTKLGGLKASDWRKPDGQPVRYLPPEFFDGASFSRGGAAAGVKIGGFSAGEAASQMVIGNMVGSSWMKLSFTFPPGFVFTTESTKQDPGKSPEADASISGTIESGTTSTTGKLKFEGGEWDDEEADVSSAPDWKPLHAAQIYFPTGSSELDKGDVETVKQVIRAIDDRAHMPDYQFTRFKIDVIGCHSRAWEGFDGKIAKLKERLARGEISQAKYDEKMKALEIEKEASNDSLAYLRAVQVKTALAKGLYSIQHRLAFDVDEKRRFNEATTRKPIDPDPEGDLGEDRSVYVIVRYRLD